MKDFAMVLNIVVLIIAAAITIPSLVEQCWPLTCAMITLVSFCGFNLAGLFE